MNKRLLLWSIPTVAVLTALFLHWKMQMPDSMSLRYREQSGDLAQFLLTEAAKDGARLTNIAAAGKVDTRWSVAKELAGFEVLMEPADTERLVRALIPVLGEPERRAQSPQILFHDATSHTILFLSTNQVFQPGSPQTPRHQLSFLRPGVIHQIMASNAHAVKCLTTNNPTTNRPPHRPLAKPTNTVPLNLLPAHILTNGNASQRGTNPLMKATNSVKAAR
jgi:hypothetical protein